MHHQSPSDTSLLVARSLMLAAKDPQLSKLVAAEEEETLAFLLGRTHQRRWFDYVLKNPWARQALFLAEEITLPGIIAHYLARKRWIETRVRDALASGTRQVIIVGAGFDTLALRLHREFPDVRFFELDHPATQSTKRANTTPAPNLKFQSIDLATESLDQMLSACAGFSIHQSSIIVVEGVTMYLTEDRVRAMLRSAATLADRVIFTFMEEQANGFISFQGEHPLIAWWLKSRREPFLWGISRNELTGWVEECGLKVGEIAGHLELKQEILCPRQLEKITLARGECLCSCSSITR